ncbi:recombinase family protein [Microbacterium lacticum]|uniref:recombinase family protein n=1 Tax=Microbacterium lacticum TaxID=33885 RepID=UPI003A886C2F
MVTDRADLTVGESIAAQRAACLAYGERVGLKIAQELVDAGDTGRGPMLDQLYNYLVKHPEVRHVIVETRSRLSPTPDGVDRISQRLERIGVRVIASDTVFTSPAPDLIQKMLNTIGTWTSEVDGQSVGESKRREAIAGSACPADAVPAEGVHQ